MNAKSLAQCFAALPPNEQAKLLATWMHALTIDARDTYIPGTQGIADPVRLRGFNELQHRLTNHLAGILEPGKAWRADDSFMEMLCEAVGVLHAVALRICVEKLMVSGTGSARRQRRAG